MEPSTAAKVAPILDHSRAADLPQEIDTCRICRGEGSDDEPLFHPCKCSGSIMYVHQDCLMEWLSHSQKKHCELCKTPFTFTKLYDPDMPSSLPNGVFVRKATGHVISRTRYWARGMLVALIWLFWLPWTMRFVWWGLFFLADVGWIHDVDFQDGGLVEMMITPMVSNGSTASSIRQPSPPGFQSSGVFRLLGHFLTSTLYHDAEVRNTLLNNASNVPAGFARVRSRTTLLSGVPFFKHVVLDRVATDVLEGLIITISLVATIVLVLLIREWVVQQQPIINMGADENPPNPALHQQAAHNEPDRDEEVRDDDDTSGYHTDVSDVPTQSASSSSQKSIPNASGDEATEGEGAQSPGPQANILDLDSKTSRSVNTDLSMGRLTQIKSLLNDVYDAGPNLRRFDRNTFAADVHRAHQDGNHEEVEMIHYHCHLVMEFHVASLALNRLVLEADRIHNIETITEFQQSLQSLDNGADYLPNYDQTVIKTRLEELRHKIAAIIDRSPNLSSFATDDISSPSSREVHTPGASYSQAAASDDLDDEGLGQPRPAMPGRDESSIATEIQRQLQEAHSMDQAQEIRQSTRRTAFVDLDGHSNSDGSWQEVAGRDVISADQPSQSRPAVVRTVNELGLGSELTSSARSSSVSLASAREPETSMHSTEHPSGPADIRTSTEQGSSEKADNSSQNSDNASGAATRQSSPWWNTVIDWLWGDIAPDTEHPLNVQNEERIVADINDEGPFVPVAADEPDVPQVQDQALNPEPARPRPALIPNEAELVDDVEELEGILELIGMQGPISGLFTNAIFAAVFVSGATTIAVWVPFLLGKLALVAVAHPISIAEVVYRAITGFSNVLIDLCIFSVAYIAQWTLNIPLNWVSAWQGFSNNRYETPVFGPMASWSINTLDSSYARMANEITRAVSNTFTASSDLTLDSHTALTHIKTQLSTACQEAAKVVTSFSGVLTSPNTGRALSRDNLAPLIFSALDVVKQSSLHAFSMVRQTPHFLLAGQLTISRKTNPSEPDVYPESSQWSALDRTLTTCIGYAAIVTIAAIYYSKLAPLASSREGRKIENTILEILQQTGGVAKVVLIISIEMLAFPLYCGLLLDVAMLPLFGAASIESRLRFTARSPWTSIFVHWFVGTCYMFHFALFVAMCRKILRRGVLYFIRDPDDPTFHPVRDVLERSVVSQLRKILSSALIYGGLVIVCLGSVLWMLAYGISGLLPIKWTSEHSFFGFPIDLILYTSLKPLLVKYLAPSDWIQRVYEWWFRRSARSLRLSHFLFGEDNLDERAARRGPGKSDDVLRTPEATMTGRWVRVPSNDQVRVGRGRRAWTDVDVNNHRQDGVPEATDVEGVGPNDLNFTKVYIPPHFGIRITLLFASLWALTAGASFALTVLPLLCGRSLFALLLPRTLWANDIYAISIGLFGLCASIFMVIKARSVLGPLPRSLTDVRKAAQSLYSRYGTAFSARTRMAVRCLYVYGVAAFVLPCLLALVVEFYILAPLHAYTTTGNEPHTVRLLRSWTLGVQYLRIIISTIQWYPESHAARALRAVTARGYADPDVGKATRYFFLPLSLGTLVILFAPLPVGSIASQLVPVSDDDESLRHLARSLVYPAILGALSSVLLLRWILSLIRFWRLRVRDEVYLIGERLHNYGERTSPPVRTIL